MVLLRQLAIFEDGEMNRRDKAPNPHRLENWATIGHDGHDTDLGAGLSNPGMEKTNSIVATRVFFPPLLSFAFFLQRSEFPVGGLAVVTSRHKKS